MRNYEIKSRAQNYYILLYCYLNKNKVRYFSDIQFDINNFIKKKFVNN